MSEINSFSDYASKYNTNMDYSSLFGGGAPTERDYAPESSRII